MYPLSPPAAYAHESAMADPRYRERMQRVLDACDNEPKLTVYADEDVPGLLREGGLAERRKIMGTLDLIEDPVLLFNTYRFDGNFEERREWAREQGFPNLNGLVAAMLGYGAFAWACYNLADDPVGHDKVCRPCWRIHFQTGCVHKCHYCSLGGLLTTMVNVEDYIVQLDRLMAAHPWQETFLLEDDADIPGLEPELGCLGPLIEHFGALKDRYLLLHTKTWNVDWMLDLPHNGKTIIVWSISGPTQSRVFEPVCGTTEERIEAARKCQDAGYQIRYKFKPIIPVRGWREDATRTVDMIFDRTRPDVISLCAFMWMSAEEMKRRLDPDMLDPEFLRAAQEAADEMADTRTQPFPEDVRAAIYEHHFDAIRRRDPEVPVSLSTENWRMWRRLGPKLGCTATSYVCGCGPNATPGLSKLAVHPFNVARGGPQGEFQRM